MSDELSRRLESKIEKKMASGRRRRGLDDGFKRGKTVNEVLDKPTVMLLYKMISDRVLSGVNGAVSAGKESVLFWATDGNRNDVALKIYLVSTGNFKRREPYIAGDPRFSGVKKGTRNMVNLWARKEFRNLSQCFDAGLPVPRPVAVRDNVLVMDFVGRGGAPAATLLNSEVDAADYGRAVGILGDMYRRAGLVHGDYSEYNMFKTGAGLVVFDMGSAVDTRHPNSGALLKRDINNINRFFSKRGVSVTDSGAVYGGIVG